MTPAPYLEQKKKLAKEKAQALADGWAKLSEADRKKAIIIFLGRLSLVAGDVVGGPPSTQQHADWAVREWENALHYAGAKPRNT